MDNNKKTEKVYNKHYANKILLILASLFILMGVTNAGTLSDSSGDLTYEGINICMADGSTQFTGNLNFGGNKIQNVSNIYYDNAHMNQTNGNYSVTVQGYKQPESHPFEIYNYSYDYDSKYSIYTEDENGDKQERFSIYGGEEGTRFLFNKVGSQIANNVTDYVDFNTMPIVNAWFQWKTNDNMNFDNFYNGKGFTFRTNPGTGEITNTFKIDPDKIYMYQDLNLQGNKIESVGDSDFNGDIDAYGLNLDRNSQNYITMNSGAGNPNRIDFMEADDAYFQLYHNASPSNPNNLFKIRVASSNAGINTDVITFNQAGDTTFNQLNGTGNDYACLDSNGKLYRSATACS